MNILFVGLGGIGQRHLRNITDLYKDKINIYAYRVRRSDFVLSDKLIIQENESLEKKYNITVFSELKDAWKYKIDIIFICNPSSLHMEILLEAIENNTNIFIEKPVSHNMDNVEEAILKADERKLITFVGFQNRYHPCIKETKKLLESNVIGDIVGADVEVGENIKNWHKYEDYRTMYASRKELGGGVVLSQIHELDYLNYFFGMPEEVFAMGGQLSDLEIDVEDIAKILAHYRYNQKRFPVSIQEDYLQSPPSRRCKIIGTNGKIEFDLLSHTIQLYDKEGASIINKTFDFQRNDMFMEELKEFLSAVEAHRQSAISLSEGSKSLRVAVAIKESMKHNSVIKL